MNKSVTMTSEKRERYAQWLRDTGVEHPSDDLIDKTRGRALLQIHEAKDKVRRYRIKVAALVFCFLVIAVCVWLRL